MASQRGVGVVAEDEQVGTGRDGAATATIRDAARRHGAHLQAVGNERAAKSEFAAQQIHGDPRRERGRMLGVERVHDDARLIIAAASRATAANGTRSRARSVASSASIRGSVS